MNNYLLLNNKKIKYISDPVSFTILNSKDKINKLPIIILFGDIHYSSKNKCNHCNIKNKCYNLHNNIIKIFNDISNENKKIDIYLEHDFVNLNKKPKTEYINNK